MTETFLLHESRLFAPVRLGQSAGYAHLDTGARHSSILQSYSARFETIGSREMHTAFGSASVPQVRLDEVLFLGKAFPAVPADVMPDQAGGFAALPFKVMLALGSDVLLRDRLYLDFPRRKLRFVDVHPAQVAVQARLAADFRLGPPRFQMALGGQALQAVFDTGAALSVFNQRSLDRFRAEIVEDQPVEAEDPTGAKLTIPTFKCGELTIGDYAFAELQFLAIDMSRIEQEAGLHVDFVLGVNGMLAKRWMLDPQGAAIEMM